MFNEIMDCDNGDGVLRSSNFQGNGASSCKVFPHATYVDQMSDKNTQTLFTAKSKDLWELVTLPSEQPPTAENKRQAWCELALRIRGRWGNPAIAYAAADSNGAPSHV